MIDKGQGTENRELELGTPTNPWTTALAMSGAPRVAEVLVPWRYRPVAELASAADSRESVIGQQSPVAVPTGQSPVLRTEF